MASLSCGRCNVSGIDHRSDLCGAARVTAAICHRSCALVPARGRRPGVRAGSRGFTLLEVLVALLLLSLALVALVRLAGLDARATAQLHEATLAQWVAANVLAETRLRDGFPAVGRSNGESTMGGRRWRWTLEVSATDEPLIRRMDVDVVALESARAEGSAARLTGFASQP